MPLRILITNADLVGPGGTQFYVRDLASELLRRGHRPVVYAPNLGPLAEEMRRTGIDVTADLDATDFQPDVIHGHHWLPALTSIARFPDTPAVYVSHNSSVRQIPRHPSFRRYLAVGFQTRDRLLHEGLDASVIRVVFNSVDLRRFTPRPALPRRPARALLFSNYAAWSDRMGPVAEACRLAGIDLDVVGSGVNKLIAAPQTILGRYDLVFGLGRCALEAMAVGAAVVLCYTKGFGPMVRSDNFDRLREMNFALQLCTMPLDANVLLDQIRLYDGDDTAKVIQRVRAEASLSKMTAQLEDIYRQVIEEHRRAPATPKDHARAWAGILAQSSQRLAKVQSLRQQVPRREETISQLRARLDSVNAQMTAMENSLPLRLRAVLGRLPAPGEVLRAAARFIRRPKR